MHKILIDRRTILNRVQELGAAISSDYAGDEVAVVAILKGAAIFAADLVRAISVPVSLEFMEVASYDGTETTGVVRVSKGLAAPVAGKNVLIVEDIVDTGLTLAFLVNHLGAQAPKTLRTCAFLSKPERRRTSVKVDYLGFAIPDEFVVGYGLDHLGRFRNLPDISVMTSHD